MVSLGLTQDVAYAVRPLPYAHAESLFVLWNMWAGTKRAHLSNPKFLD